jgi:protein gp37
MAKNSKIEWTHHTFNPWWGCTKVSAACKRCYAETWAKRVGEQVWGAKAPRRFLSDQHWREPLRWNAAAARQRERRRVFCASMADVFEPRNDLESSRQRLWELIEQTPWLDWLLLTKRPERIGDMVPWVEDWPRNIWLGCTAETQHWVDKRLPYLLENAAAIHFVSCEPLLGKIDLRRFLPGGETARHLSWVIAGGESGHGARPMNPDWAASLRDQCQDAGAAFHFKQWGHWAPEYLAEPGTNRPTTRVRDERGQSVTLVRLPKREAGRELFGRVWDEFPTPAM